MSRGEKKSIGGAELRLGGTSYYIKEWQIAQMLLIANTIKRPSYVFHHFLELFSYYPFEAH